MTRLPPVALLLAACALPALAQTGAPAGAPTSPAPAQRSSPATAAPAPTSATPAPAASPAEADPVLARVDGQEIRLSEVMETAAEALPAELRNVPPATLRALLPPPVFQQLVDRAVTDRVLVAAARREGLERDEEVRRRVRAFEEGELRDALLRREILPKLTDEALRARWERDRAGRPAEEEVRARHILVREEAEARAIIGEIQRGANFEEVARRRSTDPAGRSNGGDLGFFRRNDMVPEFATAAFNLQPGQMTPNPVRSQFGWHVIRVEERRTGQGPGFDESREALRQAMIEEEVQAMIGRLRQSARVEIVEPPAPAGVQADPPARPGTPSARPAPTPPAPATPAPAQRR
ncbi:peptidylprolyl isomerase [Sabulicella glaciei]|uniref:Parvulin-like PPIase n=1 Tax=Sabulicella glaciei TaxID=2984948 RepID=A0ABT3NVQ6_9PROT|nr:peptidylprolyl isomerase [Roseococcus sp. MDT2-1-1]MCW8086206.1 peptidylprolyl isomerase [Roseococcus sp. MDT2-1-1]